MIPHSSKTDWKTYVLDTNVYVDIQHADRIEDAAEEFILRHPIQVSSVVMAELLLGAAASPKRSRMLQNIRQQINTGGAITPDIDDWQTAALTWTRIASQTTERRSFWNDLLLAASCARTRATLITANHTDFVRIARYIPVRHVAPWPSEHGKG